MKVAIIILNYNDHENTIRYVNEINSYNSIDKIIVVDNNSTNKNELEKLNKLKNNKTDVIKSDKNGGYSYGNNFGLKYLDDFCNGSQYDLVIISNPDVSIEKEDLEESIKYIRTNENVALCAPRMHYINGPARRSAWKKRNFLLDVIYSSRVIQAIALFPIFNQGEYTKKEFNEKYLKTFAVSGAFFIIKHDIFKEIGYFDENVFLFYEEDIISQKLEKIGYDVYSLNKLKFMHYDSRCIGKFVSAFKKKDIIFDSRIYYQKKYNGINLFQVYILKFLKFFKNIELCIELPFLKIIAFLKNT
ncbi:MAG: glycosyltransferase family 2 protein [Clostridia bacterium]